MIIDLQSEFGRNCAENASSIKRFTDELKRAQDANIKLITCEHGGDINQLADVNKWYNPRLKVSPMAVNGQRLFKILYSISKKI